MTNKMHLCRIIHYSLAALHVSSDIFAHRQEHLNCITASGITPVCRFIYIYINIYIYMCRSQRPRGLRRRSAAAHLLSSGVRIPLGAWIFVCCECRILLGRGICDELITHPEESYRLWCVVLCHLENLKNQEAMTRLGSLPKNHDARKYKY